MRKMMGLTMVGMVVVVAMSTVIAAAADNANALTKLSLTDAVKMAYDQNLDYKSAALDLKSSELSLKETEANALQSPNPTSLLQAKQSWELAQRTFSLKKGDLMLNVANAYFSAAKADNLVGVNGNALKSSQENLKTVEAKVAAGAATPLDVIKQQADGLNKESNFDKAKRNRELAYLKLTQLLRLPAGTALELSTKPTYKAISYDVEADLAKALISRTDIIQANNSVEAKRKAVELATNSYTAPITLEKSKIDLEKAIISLETTKNNAINEVRQNYINLLSSYNSILSGEKNLAAATETLRVTKLRYEANMVTSQDLLDAQNSMVSSQTDLTSAIFDYQVSKIQYLKSLGTEFELE